MPSGYFHPFTALRIETWRLYTFRAPEHEDWRQDLFAITIAVVYALYFARKV
jgi:hypothetical protein